MDQRIFLLIFFVSVASIAGQRISTAKIGDNRYFISWHNPYAPRLNFFLAYQYCRTIAMELVALESAEEAQALNDYIRLNTQNQAPVADFWTASNTLGANTWLWMSNGSPLNGTFNYWPNGQEPTRSSDANCLLMEQTQSQSWKAENCLSNHHFVCEQTRCYFYNFNPFAPLSTTNPGGNNARSIYYERAHIDQDDHEEVSAPSSSHRRFRSSFHHAPASPQSPAVHKIPPRTSVPLDTAHVYH